MDYRSYPKAEVYVFFILFIHSFVHRQPRMIQQLRRWRSFVPISVKAFVQKVMTIWADFLVLYLRYLVTICDYLLGLIEILFINLIAPRISTHEHLYNSTAKRPYVAFRSATFLFDYFRGHPLNAAHYGALERCEAGATDWDTTWTWIGSVYFEFSGTTKVA